MKASGNQGSKMATVSGKARMSTSASGRKTNQMALVSTLGRTEIFMRGSGSTASDMAKVWIPSSSGTNILENTLLAKPRDMASTHGLTGTITLVNFITALKMGKEPGKRAGMRIAISIWASTKMI